MNYTDSVHDLLSIIGPGHMPAIAYDTAWVARLGDVAPDISNRALDWICSHQLPDGSWGAAEPFYYHDRVISTLAAMIAIAQRGRRSADKKLVERGLAALNRIVGGATQGLAADPNGETIGFEMIAPTLVAEAHRLGLIPSQDNRILGRMGDVRKIKQTKLKQRISRYVTPAFSAEMAGPDIDMLNIDELPESNGSVGYSPAASAYFALIAKPGDPNALAYLRNQISEDGGLPNVAPFDNFEVGWILWNLAMNKQSLTQDPMVAKHARFLHNSWLPGRGAAFGAGYSVPDGDTSGIVFEAMKRYNVSLDIEAILSYELDEYFQCLALEANPSTSTNAHILGALRSAGMPSDAPSVKKALGFLARTVTSEGYWFDKWHLSPYYVTCHVIIACSGYAPELVLQAVDWVLDTQREDGSWGIQIATAEETAYCVQALATWEEVRTRRETQKVAAAIKKAIPWLMDHAQPPYLPLWIGKGLYCPENVIQSAILSALALAGA